MLENCLFSISFVLVSIVFCVGLIFVCVIRLKELFSDWYVTGSAVAETGLRIVVETYVILVVLFGNVNTVSVLAFEENGLNIIVIDDCCIGEDVTDDLMSLLYDVCTIDFVACVSVKVIGLGDDVSIPVSDDTAVSVAVRLFCSCVVERYIREPL